MPSSFPPQGVADVSLPVVTNARQIVDGPLYGKEIRVVGRVRDAVRDTTNDQFNFLIIDCGGSLLYGGLPSTNRLDALRDLQRFVGCEVEFTCRCRKCDQSDHRKALTVELDEISPDGIRIRRESAHDVFDAPPLELENPDWEAILTAGPRTVKGAVVARWGDDAMLIRTASGESVAVTLNEPGRPDLYEAVEVVGAPNTRKGLGNPCGRRARGRRNPVLRHRQRRQLRARTAADGTGGAFRTRRHRRAHPALRRRPEDRVPPRTRHTHRRHPAL